MQNNMKRQLTITALTIIGITLASLSLSLAKDTPKLAAIYQLSYMEALKNGAYTGLTTIGKLKEHGDFGIGTVEGLDGELIALEGKFYQAKSNGEVKTLGDDVLAPFANVCFFKPMAGFPVAPGKAVSFKELKDHLEKMIQPEKAIYAIKIQGVFNKLKLRSPPKQTKPYPRLSEALKGQKIFKFKATKGAMVGFLFPDQPEIMYEVNFPGYHFHFIGDKREIGGHVLDCSIDKATVSWMKAERLLIDMPVSRPNSR